MANGLSDQLRKASPKQNSMVIDCEPDKPHWGWTWLDRWMAARPWESPFFDELMHEMDGDREDLPAKIVEMDTGRPQPGTATKKGNGSMSETGSFEPNMASAPYQATAASPFAADRPHHQQKQMLYGRKTCPAGRLSIPSPVSDGVAAATIHDLSPTALAEADLRAEEDSIVSTAQSSLRYGSTAGGRQSIFGTPRVPHDYDAKYSEDLGGYHNYMATTESAKAKMRSQSAPKQRPDPPEKVALGSKKRLSMYEGGGRVAASMAARMQRSSSQVRSAIKGLNPSPIRRGSAASVDEKFH